MSKKKNTLKDLDEFLKQQAATIVPPAKLSERIDNMREGGLETAHDDVKTQIVDQIAALSRKENATFRQTLYDIILRSIEAQATLQQEDTLLINTVLYLRHGDNWKESIIQYWKKRYREPD